MKEGVEVKIQNRESLREQDIIQLLRLFQLQFPVQTPEEICQSIIEYLRRQPARVEREEQIVLAKREQQKQDSSAKQYVIPQRKTKWMRQTTFEEQKAKYQEQMFIAKSFCEHGINYHLVVKVYPQMLPKSYRCYVQAANNQAVNDIIDFLRYECNVQIQKLNRDQKRSMRTQLTKVRQWLGNRDINQLQTYFKFIHRHYNKSIEITYEQAIKLYKTLISIIKSPHVNVMEDQQALQIQDDNSSRNDSSEGVSGLNQTEEKAVIIQYIKSRDLAKVSDALCQTYEYSLKWSIHSVKHLFKGILAKSINKLVNILKKLKKGDFEYYFTAERLELLFSAPQSEAEELRIKMLSYYMEKRTNYNKVNQIIDRIRHFYQARRSSEEQEVELPKIQTSMAKIEIKREEKLQLEIKTQIDQNAAYYQHQPAQKIQKEQLYEEETSAAALKFQS